MTIAQTGGSGCGAVDFTAVQKSHSLEPGDYLCQDISRVDLESCGNEKQQIQSITGTLTQIVVSVRTPSSQFPEMELGGW
jgi:hypothetical protein